MKLKIVFGSIFYLWSMTCQRREHSYGLNKPLISDSKQLGTRLDSLQGTWVDEQDSLNKIKFFNSYRLAIYNNTARLQDTLRFYLDDKCLSTMEQLKKPDLTTGKYLNLFVSKTRFICHEIDYLTEDEFCYISGGQHLACFKRCNDFPLPKQ